MALRASFGTAMEGDDDQVAALHQVVDDATDHLQVGVLQRVAVVTKGAEANLLSHALDDGTLHATFDAAEEDALLAQAALGALDTLLPEVVGVVVGHAHVVEAHLFQAGSVAGGGAEAVAVGA